MNLTTSQFRSLLAATALTAGACLPGCTTSRTFVLESAPAQRDHTVACLRQMPSTVDVAPAVAARFERELSRRLAPDASIAPAPDGDLVIGYRFVLFDSGNAAARVGSGVASLAGSPFYGLGDGDLGIDVTFTDRDGRSLGHIVVNGPISGFFGSTGSGLAAAAGAVAKYAKANFLAAPAAPGEEPQTRETRSAPASPDRVTASRE